MKKLNNYYANYTISLQELIEKEEVDVFNFNYESMFKEDLERRFINKYYFREIGYETYSMWHFKFKEQWLNSIEHFNKLFEVYKDIKPLLDYKEVREYLEKEVNEGNEDSMGTSINRNSVSSEVKQKDTPVSAFINDEVFSYVANNTDEGLSEGDSNVNINRDNIKDVDITETKEIMSDSMLKRLNEFVKTYIDIKDRFINGFNNLFMLIY